MMTHCTMDDLIAVRDGEGSAAARRHLEDCTACRAELEALHQRVAQLKALPALRPPRDRWPAVRAAVLAGRERRRRTWGAWSLAAAAAVAALIVFNPLDIGGGQELHAALRQAKQQSATLETALQTVSGDDRVISAGNAMLCNQLEDRIAVIDAQLDQWSAPRTQAEAALVQLWQQRVQLMRQLYGVRSARATYVGL